MPKKFIRKPAPKFETNAYFDGVKKISLEDYKGKQEGGLGNISFPLISDVDRKIATDYGVVVNTGVDQGACLRRGEPALDAAVELFYKKILDDSRVSYFFKSTDMTKQKKQQKAFLSMVLDGPKNYNGKNMKDAHAGLNIEEIHFNAIVENLVNTLNELKVDENLIKIIGNALEPLRKDICIDINKHKESFKLFILMVTGGPKKFTGKNLKEAHSNMKINDLHFNAFKDNFLQTLKEMQVDPQTFQEIIGLFEQQRINLVNVKLPLIERIEGDKGIQQIVGRSSDRVLQDPRIRKTFLNIDLQILKTIIGQIVQYAIKGQQVQINGKSMKEYCQQYNFNDMHYNLIKDNILQGMKDVQKDPISINEVNQLTENLRNEFVSVKISIYQRIGGEESIKKFVQIFYQKILQDPRVKEFFKSIDMYKQIDNQNNFLTMVLGGPNNYKGRNMKEAHQHLKLNDMHFNVIKDHICKTLTEIGVDNITVQEIAKLVETLRKEIVSIRPPLFERLGGEKTLTLIVDKFFDKLINNQVIGFIFKNVDPVKHKSLLLTFFTTTFGGQNIIQYLNFYLTQIFVI
ncbi:protozoan cyanobacterial globin family protein, putative [Ichthyophthirius multifiliis]|uniref:Protozoan cyanobacterial globin family protein, putative n=1 Tax=Ichthyophthirius multifiliis TaxID=5932 RepID=G0QK08_ICHMU|nr:protozoan cyanobacterial globin family protein, putative [Ichthyophthirius multifiliis]EGR34445.1 protozoan cyanobacterial globin family protein, putative [Ichthyophthirius multifiliis]|eukprot:XP_004039749.1 protozoan cyanobacterial globin family protein, putative [Ichthyophthirius multifiliis]